MNNFLNNIKYNNFERGSKNAKNEQSLRFQSSSIIS